MKISLRTFHFPIVFLPFLWDYYIFDLKLFDILALGVAVFCIIFNNSIHLNSVLKSRVFLFLSFFIFHALVGVAINADFKGFLGLLFGITFFIFICLYFKLNDVNKYSKLMLKIMVGFFSVQFFSILIFGEPINYHAIIGDIPRLQNAWGYRTSGLYLEPTSYCAMSFMILSTRFINNHFGKWEAIGIATIILSASLYGLFVAFFCIIIWAFQSRYFAQFVLVSCIFITILAAIIGYAAELILTPTLNALIFERLPLIATDASILTRYPIFNGVNLPINQIIFGHGLSTINSSLGVSGLGYLIGGTGILGFFIFFALIINLFRVNLKLIILSLIVILMSSMYWTFMVFWMWLGWLFISVVKTSKRQINSVEFNLVQEA